MLSRLRLLAHLVRWAVLHSDYRTQFSMRSGRQSGWKAIFVSIILINHAVASDTVEPPAELPVVHIEGVVPGKSATIDQERVPSNVQVLERERFEETAPLSLNHLLNQQIGSVTVADAQNNPLQAELSYRGFAVSPLLGLPQGLAIYANGTRVNEAFGDTVNFDLMPEFAIERVQLIPGSKPVYGLNALGGALTIDMKDGFSFPSTELELYTGSFGRTQGTAQYGTNDGTRAYYVGGTHFSEDGWRQYHAGRQQSERQRCRARRTTA